MRIPTKFQSRYAGITLGILAALLLWSPTGKIIKSQLALTFPIPANVAPWNVKVFNRPDPNDGYVMQRFHETAKAHPNDFQLQFANAPAIPPFTPPNSANNVPHSPTNDQINNLRELTHRFPNSPVLCAGILRYCTLGQVRIVRKEAEELAKPKPANVKFDFPAWPQSAPENLANFNRDAEEGEKIDPTNAYFPTMQAISLFAGHHDVEALAALQRASQMTTWEDYASDEARAQMKLHEQTFGDGRVSLPTTMIAASILLPHYSGLRAAARVAVHIAIEKEKVGKFEEGLAIRNSVRKFGDLMQNHSKFGIGSLVGGVISSYSLILPGALPDVAETFSPSDKMKREKFASAFNDYLLKCGHPELIAEVNSEGLDREQVYDVFSDNIGSFTKENLNKSGSLWISGIILFSSAIWILLFGGAGALLARHPKIQAGLGLVGRSWVAPILGGLTGLMLAGIGFSQVQNLTYQDAPRVFDGKNMPNNVAPPFAFGILVFAIFAIALPATTRSDRLRRVSAYVATLIATSVFCNLFFWQSVVSVRPILSLIQAVRDTSISPNSYYYVPLSFSIAIPLIFVLALSALSIIWRIPLSVGIARGLKGCCVPIACTLLLAYAAILPFTLKQEILMTYVLDRTLTHEGRFIAEQTGKSWPTDFKRSPK